MHPDYLLFGLGTVFAVVTTVLLVYMIASKKKTSFYRKVLAEDTSTFNPYTETARLSQSPAANASTASENDTETIGTYVDATQTLGPEEGGGVALDDINTQIFEGKYIIEEEIHGGGMSRIFLARNVKLGNQWVIKYVDHKNARLANEEHILKQLNHLNLPQIIDIFHDQEGLYLVERYIEGFPLNKVFALGQQLGQSLILDWAEQLTQVLAYLHNLANPIIHCDLKPSNIMVTHDNRLVLIDFDISKQQGIGDEQDIGVTYSYAAPEQLKHSIRPRYQQLIADRFGSLPHERFHWQIDERTDIYSLGVILFEMAMGAIPTTANHNLLKDRVSPELAAIIYRCLAIEPQKRYQSAKDLLADLQEIKNTKVSMARVLFMRKAIAVVAGVSVFLSGCSFSAGAYLYQQENLAVLGLDPDAVMLSEQQTATLFIQKTLPSGKVQYVNPVKIDWSYGGGDIARIEGDRIIGINEGVTDLYGRYRNKVINLQVNVVKPMDGRVEISLRYLKDVTVSTLAGTGERELHDGSYLTAAFISPESIDLLADGSIVITDAGKLRILKEGKIETIDFEPSYLAANMVRCFGNDIYILTHEWEEKDGKYYGIIKLTEKGAQGLFISEAVYTKITDFAFAPDGAMYFIEHNLGVRDAYLHRLDTETGDSEVVAELDEGVSALAIDEKGRIYLANSETGSILYLDMTTSQLKHFAGIEGDRHFIDGNIAKFYEPRKLKIEGDQMYVLDYNSIRRITIDNGIALFTETIAGEVTTDNNPETRDGTGSDLVLAPSRLMDLAVVDGGIILTDPKKSVVREILLGMQKEI